MTFCERDIKQAGAEQCQAQVQLGKLDKLQYYWKLGLAWQYEIEPNNLA